MKHVVMFSGGIGSWLAAKRVAACHGTDDMTLLFSDTLIEDDDTYRFVYQAAQNIGAKLEWITEGRTPWQVMSDRQFIGNTRVDPCSLVLKRDFLDAWRDANCSPTETIVYIGIDWSESHRLRNLLPRVAPWIYQAPLCNKPFISKNAMIALAAAEGLAPPRLYALGFAHNNCGGTCIKAGQAQWALLLRTFPDRYAQVEKWENEMRLKVGDHSILRDRRGGTLKPLPLSEFRKRVESGDYDGQEWGGCGCALE